MLKQERKKTKNLYAKIKLKWWWGTVLLCCATYTGLSGTGDIEQTDPDADAHYTIEEVHAEENTVSEGM